VRKKFGRHEGAFTVPSTSKVTEWHASDSHFRQNNSGAARSIPGHTKQRILAAAKELNLSLAKTLGVLSFTPLTMLQACAQAVDFKVGHHFGEGQVRS
jgi:hypothetical protein